MLEEHGKVPPDLGLQLEGDLLGNHELLDLLQPDREPGGSSVKDIIHV